MSITDWDKRLLCADGACVGLIGPDGTCKACGRVSPNWGDERRRGLKSTGEVAQPAPADGDARGVDKVEDPGIGGEDDEGDDDDDGADDSDDDDYDDDDDDGDEDGEPDDDGVMQASAGAAKSETKGPGEWDQRELCSNGACIGVISDDGTCKTCGARA